ncbi:hypothetical protein Pan44_03800 [Caulifigura coniformis]|uniref:Tetratricopeptide repeat protein n=1 Tax=Caulifigura coniformis TaxID=2527983 RepID=A0A517S8D0_9PLAN|nr:hypothetical protein [Caulifigura coniformis]QDT52370.1 hypothetical protein Pan44_03800 [Caulifigura coniformis]
MKRRIAMHGRTTETRRPVAMGLAAAVWIGSAALANDVIHLKQPGSEAVIPVPATIDDFTGKFIRFRVGTNVRQELTSNVVQTDHAFSEGFKRGQNLFRTGDYAAAEEEWKQDVLREPKAWVRREIRAWLIRAAWRQDHWPDAANQFLEIVAEDPDTFHWPIAPLTWTPALREADRTQARRLLEDSRPVARLLGASFLLKDAHSTTSAERVLKDLMRDVSPQVAGLAKAQLWRTQIGPPISDPELARWRSHIAFLPETLRGGPQFVLAAATLQRSEFDRAAAEFLWVPLVYSQNEPTAARASLEAGVSLLRAGRRDDAVKILKETVDNFTWSDAAREAKSRLMEVAPD